MRVPLSSGRTLIANKEACNKAVFNSVFKSADGLKTLRTNFENNKFRIYFIAFFVQVLLVEGCDSVSGLGQPTSSALEIQKGSGPPEHVEE